MMLTKLRHMVLVVLAGTLVLFMAPNAKGQEIHSPVTDLMSTPGTAVNWVLPIEENSAKSEQFKYEISQFTDQLQAKKTRYKHEIDFWRYVFYKVHRKFLKQYRTPATLEDLLVKGQYDCLSGTALYAIIFDQLGADYQIVETTYHIFLKLVAAGETILVESTNPLNGFISDQADIEKMERAYIDDRYGSWSNEDYYRSRVSVNQAISIKQLAGLQFYNQAVEAYNQRNLLEALKLQERALNLYPSERLGEMMTIMLRTLEKDTILDPFQKQYYLSKYHNLNQPLFTAQKER